MELDDVYDDVIFYILEYLTDQEKIIFFSVNKKFNKFKYEIYFYTEYDYDKIKNLPYYNRFKQIKFTGTENIPIETTNLIFHSPILNYVPLTKDTIPKNVKRLKFGPFFNLPLNDCIHDGITHVKFGKMFNQPIIGQIPKSVVCLKLNDAYTHSIKHSIPQNIIYFKILCNFNFNTNDIPKTIKKLSLINYFSSYGSIPNNITYLKLNYYCEIKPDNIPYSVTHIKFGKYFQGSVGKAIPNSVKYMIFKGDKIEINKIITQNVICIKLSQKLYDKYKNDIPTNIKIKIISN
ncbi:putative F-box and FNIP repeat-containing protein [Cotonvirus japonicus]|uniref:F-box and FNIP repeat-containing protein n=1 Tax=Cotonvirus japonicus TaxID=2811091 RepID=A0ABM7NRG6_9VIRU|nr:putative F-box and FNIP repeat-containing protein [Cotonvirus japonicus]BCS82686.1 putative F-box and FNIP repeat-containing protein [Cotonvirus japonicus]